MTHARLMSFGCVAIALVACEPTEPAKPPPVPQVAWEPEAPPVLAVVATDAGAVEKKAVAPPTFPPSKPTVISLARTGDAALDTKLGEADAAYAKEDYTSAVRLYNDAARAFPRRASPSVGLARCEVARVTPNLEYATGKGNPRIRAGLALLQRMAKLEPEFAPTHAEIGRTLLLLGDAPGAIEPLRRASRALPLEPEVHSALGVALLASGKGEEAVASLARAAELDPGSAPRRGNFGTVLFMRGRVDDAVKEYEAEVAIDPADARARSDLGTALLARNDFPGAMRELEKAVALDPSRATFRSNLGYALQLQGKKDLAIASYREAIRLDAKLASAWINLATVLAKDPKTRKEARSALEKARSLDPQDPRVIANFDELDALEKGVQAPAGGEKKKP